MRSSGSVSSDNAGDAGCDAQGGHVSVSVTSPVRRASRLSSSAGIFDLDEEGLESASSSTDYKLARDRFSSHGSSQHGSVSSRSSRNLFDVQEEEVAGGRLEPSRSSPNPFVATSPLFTDPFRSKTSSVDKPPRNTSRDNFIGNEDSLDPKSSPSSNGRSPSLVSAHSVTSFPTGDLASSLRTASDAFPSSLSDKPTSPVHLSGQPQAQLSPSWPTSSLSTSTDSSASQPCHPFEPQSSLPAPSTQPLTAHASTGISSASIGVSANLPSCPSTASNRAVGRLSVRKMSLDTTPSFSSPLAFASILPADEDNDEGPTSITIGETVENSDSRKLHQHTGESSASVATDIPMQSSRRSTSSSDPFAFEASSDFKQNTVGRKTSMRRDPSGLGSMPLIKPASRFDRERSASNSLHRAATGAARINLTPSRQASSAGASAADDDTSSTTSDDFTAGSNLTRKSSVTSSGSMGPPAVPRRGPGAGAGSNSPMLHPVDKPISTIAMGKMKEDSSLGLGLPSSFSSSSSAFTPPSSSFGSGSPAVTKWENRENRIRSGSGASWGTPPAQGGSAVLNENRRRRMTSSSFSSGAHRRARSLGGVLLGDGTASPIGGPDGVDPNLVAAIEAQNPSLPAAVPIPTGTSHRSGSVSSTGTQGGSSFSNSSFGPSSVPTTPLNASRLAQRSRRYSQVVEDDEAGPTSDSAASLPTAHRRSRVRSQTLLSAGGSPGQDMSSGFEPSSLGRVPGGGGLADAIRLQKVPAAVRMAADLFPSSSSSSPRGMYKSHSSKSMDMTGGNWGSSGLSNLYQADDDDNETPDTSGSHGLGLGLSSESNHYRGSSNGRLHVPQTPNATRSNSPLASEYSYSTGAAGSGSASPANELRTQRGSGPVTEYSSHPLAVSIPIGRSFGSPVSLPGSTVPNSRISETPVGLMDHDRRGPRSSLNRYSGLPASTSAYSALLSLNASSQSSPVSEKRLHLSPNNLAPQVFSWDEQDLYDSLNDSETGRIHIADKPAPWIESSQDTPSRVSAAQMSFDKRRSTQGILSSSIGADALLNIPSAQSRRHRPSDASLLASAGVGSNGRPSSGTDEYARIILQSRNAKMQKWRAQNSRIPNDSSDRTQRHMETLPAERDKSSFLEKEAFSGQSSLARRGTTAGMTKASSGLLNTPMTTRRASVADSNDSIESQLGEDEASQRGHEKAFAEFEWVDWLDEYRKMKEAKLRAEKEETTKVNADAGARLGGEQTSPSSIRQCGKESSVDHQTGSEFVDSGRLAILQGHKDGHRSVSDPLSRQSLQATEEAVKAQDEADAKEVEDALAIDLGTESEATISNTAAKQAVQQQPDAPRRPEISSSHRSQLAVNSLRSAAQTSPEQFGSAAPVGSQQQGFSPVKKLGSEKSKNNSLSPVTTRATPSLGYTSVAGAPYSHASRGRRKHLGGKIEAWWSAVKTGFTAPGGDTWSRNPQISATQSSSVRATPARDPISSLTRSLQQDASSPNTSRSSTNALARGDSWHSPAPSGHASSPMVTHVQSGFENPSQIISTFQSGLDAGKPPTPPHTRQQGAEAALEEQSALVNRSEHDKALPATVTPKDAAKRKQQPKLSLQFDKGLSSFDAQEFDRISRAKLSPSTTSLSSSRSRDPMANSKTKDSPTLTSGADVPTSPDQRSDSAKRPALEHKWSSGRGSGMESDSASKAVAATKEITINSIRQHIRHRLLGSKESCDRELRRIINAINSFVELDLERQKEEARHNVAGDYDVNELEEVLSVSPALERPLTTSRSQPMSRNISSSSSHSEAEDLYMDTDVESAPPFATVNFEESRNSSSSQLSREYKLSAPPPLAQTSALATAARVVSSGSTSNPIKSSNLNPLGRTKSINRTSRSVSNSRSTSRSHSPMPGAMMSTNLSSASGSPRLSPSRRPKGPPGHGQGQQPWITALEELVTAAMEVLDVTISSLIARPGLCSELIATIQTAGRLWDEHTEWPGRGWFIEILLAVAGLSRVVEWWEAEKGFWNFNDEEEQDIEPIRFSLGNQHGDQVVEPYEHSGKGLAPWVASTSSSPTRARSFSVQEVTYPARMHTSGSNSPALSAIRQGTDLPTDMSPRPSMSLVSRDVGEDQPEQGDQTVVEADRSPLIDDREESAPTFLPISGQQARRLSQHGIVLEVESEDQVQPSQAFKSAGVNVLMELSLDDQHLLYMSPAWKAVIGSNTEEMYDTPIEDLLAPGDADVFAEASRQLEANHSHTVEAAFRLRVEKAAHQLSGDSASDPETSSVSSSDSCNDVIFYQEMEGKGMLMLDRQTGTPSHSMWVFKAVGPAEPEDRVPATALPKTGRSVGNFMDSSGVAHAASISVEPVLCRICERDVPTWFFEKHSEICNETHRLDMEIGECNESLREMRKSIQDLYTRLDEYGLKSTPEGTLEYRGFAISTPPASNQPPSALEGLNRSISGQPNAAAVRKAHLRAIDTAIEVLQTAAEISTPAITDEHADEPIEKQRLLSPNSENKIVTVQQWRRTPLEDAALDMLMVDVENAMRSKLSAVNRMLNTIVYVETVRQEWEERVEAALVALSDSDDQGSQSESGSVFSGSESGKEDDIVDDIRSRSLPLSEKPVIDDPHPVQSIEDHGSALLPHAFQTLSLSADSDIMRSRQPSSETTTGDKALSTDDVGEDDDGLLAGGMLLERNERDLPAPNSDGPSALAIPGGDVDDIPALDDDKMGGSTAALSPIPIPRGSSTGLGSSISQSHSGSGLKASISAAQTMPSHAPQRRSVSRSRRASHLPSINDGLLSTPPMSPHLLSASESFGIGSRHQRRTSVSHRSPMAGSMPLSPRLPPVAPSSKPTASSIKDFDFLKPISKGAFGSVYLAKKRTTGDYYAIKVLKKSDMIAKNQITNVKAERMILMLQNQSPFVVKLYFTFQNSGYLFLVMEYLPGGDCATLGKVMGALPEEWARQYVAEVVVGLELLHSKGVVHRDLKPDNLLIDQKGHLKLTDFGLSKIGLLGRQTRQSPPSAIEGRSSHVGGSDANRADSFHAGSAPQSVTSFGSHTQHPSASSPSGTTTGETIASLSPITPSSVTPGMASIMRNQSFYIAPQQGKIVSPSTDVSDSSEPGAHRKAMPEPMPSARIESPGNFFGNHPLLNENFSQSGSGSVAARKFVGTPDYLAPESILGIGMDDFAVDWWALGVILYEFIYGIPPFHAETPEKVFDNILSRRIDWQEDSTEVTPEARDLMESLMCTDPKRRLGSRGVDEIKKHPFFADFDWDNVTAEPGPFVPQVADPESTDYFDLRGASQQDFEDDTVHGRHDFAKAIEGNRHLQNRAPLKMRSQLDKLHAAQAAGQNEEFGNFSYKNLPVLKQANDEVIRKMKEDQMPALAKAMEQTTIHTRHRSFSGKARPTQRVHSQPFGPPSPAQSVSSQGSTPSRSTAPASPAGIGLLYTAAHRRRTSEQSPSTNLAQQGVRSGVSGSGTSSSGGGNDTVTNAAPISGVPMGIVNRKRQQLSEAGNGGDRRNSMPTRIRTKSVGFNDKPALPPHWQQEPIRRASRAIEAGNVGDNSPVASISPSASLGGGIPGRSAGLADSAVAEPDAITCLVAEDNPIALRMLETILTKLGCHCTTVRNGAEAVRLAMGDTKYGVLFVDVTLPIVNGQDVARMVKSTRNANSTTPIVALASYDRGDPVDVSGSVFDAVLAKPLERMDVCATLSNLGFTPTQAAAIPEDGQTSKTAEETSSALSMDARPLLRKSPNVSRASTQPIAVSGKMASASAGIPASITGGSPRPITPYSSSPLTSSVLTSRFLESSAAKTESKLDRTQAKQDEEDRQEMEIINTLTQAAEKLSLS